VPHSGDGGNFNTPAMLKALTYYGDGDLPTVADDMVLCPTAAALNVRRIPDALVRSRSVMH